ncbi:MAG: SurA N-terminal domain-containing protein [Candidatus Shapirobacteria bacterium]
MKKIVVIHGGLVAVIIIALIFGYIRFWNVATVNGVAISRIDYLKTLVKQDNKQILEMMIQEAMIVNEATKKGVVVDQKAVDEEISKIETQLKADGQDLDVALKASGMTKADLEKQIRIKKLVTLLSSSKIEITQGEIDEFLKTNKSSLPTGKTKEELQTLAKDELIAQADQASASAWLQDLSQNAKVEYK